MKRLKKANISGRLCWKGKVKIATFLGMLLIGSMARATVYTVVNQLPFSTDVGSLAWAVDQVNAGSGGDTIQFNIAGSAPFVIVPATNLLLQQSVTIDGTSQPGYNGSPIISINSSGGYIKTMADYCNIIGLQSSGVSGSNSCIFLESNYNTVTKCYLGTDITGTTAGLTMSGVVIDGSHNRVGGAGEGNLISGCNSTGITISSGTDNVVQGNIIGLDVTGSVVIPNAFAGVFISNGAPGNIIGGSGVGERNVISGSTNHGIMVQSGGNTIKGNYIGLDTAGSSVKGNRSIGIYLYGSVNNNQIGGSAAGEGNVISGSTQDGIYVSGGSGHVIQGNIIGMNAAGTAAFGNGGYGIHVRDNAANITIGGGTGAGNFISGNTSSGIYVGLATGTVIKGNYIGTNKAGTAAISNGSNGLSVASTTRIGGTGAGEGNLISGNTGVGLYLTSSQDTVEGNIIGLDYTGSSAIPNTSHGIESYGSSVVIGNGTAGSGNVISGNGGYGINMLSGNGSAIKGNYIGVNKAGTAAVPNTVGIWLAGQNCKVGGGGLYDGNVISGNTGNGITVGGSGMKIDGNIIGLNADGDAAIANGQYGITITYQNDTVGSSGAGNIISGNTLAGIYLSLSSQAVIRANYIGLNKAGTAAIANGSHGIHFNGAFGLQVGGKGAGEGNVISGNSGSGVYNAAGDNLSVLSNTIGMNAAGTAAIPNAGYGIYLNSYFGTIGDVDAGNYISGNDSAGIFITTNGYGAIIKGNYIGVNKAGTAAIPNGKDGIKSTAGSVRLGGSLTGEGNVISGNQNNGVSISVGTTNTVQGNTIGRNALNTASIPNGGAGLDIWSSTNTVGGAVGGTGNVIAGNTGNGITVSGTATEVIIRHNSIFGNGGLGIDLNDDGVTQNDSTDADNGVNSSLNFPVITSVVHSGGNTTISGTYAGVVFFMGKVELFSNTTSNVSGYGEGETFLDEVTVNADNTGHATFSKTVPGTYSLISATATTTFYNYTSEFSRTGPVFTTQGTPTLTVCQGTEGLDLKSLLHVSDIMPDQTLTWSQSVAPLHGILNIVSATQASGDTDINTEGTISYTPADAYSGVDSFTIQVTDGGAIIKKVVYVVVNSTPSITAVSSNGTICAGVTLSLSSSASGSGTLAYSWSGPNSFSSTVQNPSVAAASTDAGGVYTLIVANNSGCADTAATTVVVNPQPLITLTDNNGPVCANNTLQLTSEASGGTGTLTYVWKGPDAYSATGNDQSITSAQPAASGTYTIVVTDDNGCSDTATTVATVYPVPVISAISNNAPVCEDKTLSLSSTASGGTGSLQYLWGGPNEYNSEDEDPIVTTAVTTDADGTYQLIVSDINHCTDTATTSVTVYPIQPIVGETTVAFGQTITLSDLVTGGTWSTTTPWTTKVTSNNGDVKGVSTGTSIISYTTTHGCVATYTVSVYSLVNVCVGQTITMSDGIAGGTWTTGNASNATIVTATGVVTGVGAGKVVMTHRVAPSGVYTTTVTVNPLAATVAVPSSVCQGQSIALTNATAGGGTWYSGNTSVAIVNSSGGVTGLSGGSVVIYFTPVAGCVTTKTVTINGVTSTTGTPVVCVGQTTVLNNATSGGTWSTSNGSYATVSPTGVVSGVSANSPIITYKWSNGCYATTVVTVKALSQITGLVSTVCMGQAIALSNNTPGGGTWTSNPGVSVNGSGVVTGVSAGVANVFFNANDGCIATKAITVNAAPVLSGTPSVCVGQTTLLNSSMTGGTWSTTNGSNATVYNGIVGGVSAGTPTISYKIPGGCYGAVAVTVKALSQISGGSTGMCQSGTMTLLNTTPGGGVWSSSNTNAATVNPSTGVVRGAGVGSAVISFTTASGGCIATRNVAINACREGATNETPTIDDAVAATFDVQLFPNPNKGTFTLSGTINSLDPTATVEVLNMLGQLIYRGTIKADQGSINEQIALGDIANGTYLLRIHTADGNKVFHFVLEH